MRKGERRKRERGRKETEGQVVEAGFKLKDIVCDEWLLNLTALF